MAPVRMNLDLYGRAWAKIFPKTRRSNILLEEVGWDMESDRTAKLVRTLH